ncbi:DUF2637 domain-containing protein [Nocardia noduli]|uniref:DUF2637 domain-containing protein n=1 Tax=Nocardia noduli TaxID=2815722 RepID=UPI001C2376CC|nr:DUF2637 domain-containing protein [Nocardia noduli]
MTDHARTSSTGAVHTAHHEADTPKSRAHGFFWAVLAVAATVSITGNATQALLHHTPLPVVAAAVAVIPPLALLAAVHGVTVLARAHTATRATRWVATAMTVLIASGAFWLSFTALRSLAITAGVPEAEAWLWPVIIEGSMAQATVALLALAHSAHGPERAHAVEPVEPIADLLPDGVDPTRITPPAPEHAHTIALAPSSEDQEFAQLALRLCARDPARRRDPELVAKALTHHHLDGWNPTRIANELNKSRSTISRILSEAAAFSDDRPPRAQTTPTSRGELQLPRNN